MFYGYSITTFAPADDVNVPMEESPIVIQNEPQIIPDQTTEQIPDQTTEQIPEQISTPVEIPTDVLSGTTEIISGTTETVSEVISGTAEILTGAVIPTEQVTGTVITGEVLSGVSMISGDKEFFSGVLSDLSGEALYNISGEVIGEVTTQSGDIIPVDLSGVSLLTQELSTIYPTQKIQINGSGLVELSSLESVITTGGAVGATYCSRIAYDNISSILKAGTWTWRQTNNYVLQGDTDQILNQGIVDKTVIEVSSGDIEKIFTGDIFAINAQIYDIYITFIIDGEKVYHRITFVYADDGQRYVLDPLRGARTIAPQKISNYLAYYNDDIDVHRYIGQGYSPSVIKEGFTVYENIIQLLQQIPEEIVSTGEILSGENITGEILSGETVTGEIVSTGEQVLSTGNIDTGNILPVENILTGTVPELIPVEQSQPVVEQTVPTETSSVTQEIVPQEEEIVTGYFNTAYDKGAYDDKIINLQKMFTRMQIYSGALDGVYSDNLIAAVYEYQTQNGLLIGQENNKSVRGYLGPKTRKSLNQSYVEYQIYEFSLAQQTQEQNISTGQTSMTGSISSQTGIDQIPVFTGQEILDQISTLNLINSVVVLFDPLANPLLFSGMMQNTGFQSALSGFVYTTGTKIGLTFNTGTKEEILKYLNDQGYETGTLTLVSVNSETLVGDVALDFAQLSGALLVPILLQSVNELSGQIAEVSLPKGAILKTADGEEFTGELAPPEFLAPEVIQEQVDQEVVSVIDVGADQHVEFEDGSGNAMYATFRVPAPGMNIGDTIDVNYSQDGENRIYMSSVNVQDIDGEPYAIFEANHFTTFYLGTDIGTFLINNDNTYATGLAVTLNMNVSGADYMRFGNTIAERDADTWVAYTTGYAWNLTGIGGDGIKRVYAQFSGNGVVRNVSDAIILDITSISMLSGLVAHIDSSYLTTTLYDVSGLGYNFTASNAIVVGQTRSGEQIMNFNGSRYASRATTPTISAYPFTVSARIKADRVNALQGIVMRSNSAATTVYYGIQLSGTKASLIAQTAAGTTSTTNGTSNLIAGKWYHIVGVFETGNVRKLYVDGVQEATGTTAITLNTTTPRWTIGSYGGSTINNYFSGKIDEVRIYNKALSITQIQNIYFIPPTFDTQTVFTGTPTLYGEFTPKEYLSGTTVVISGYTIKTTTDGTGKWKTVPFTTGLANGTYNVTINYSNVYGDTGTVTYTGGLIVSLPGSTGLHVDYDHATWTNTDVLATLTGLDPTYMIVNNYGSELYTFTDNGTFEYQYIDKQGTTGTLTATVTRIDKTVPTFAGVTLGAYYSGNKTITFSDANLSGATLDGIAYTSGTTISSEGTHIFVVSDLAGNSTGATFVIDKTMPTFAGVTSGTYYSGNKTITFSDANLSGATLDGVPYTSGTTISSEGTHIFIVSDRVGNSTGATFIIDKTTPTFAGVISGTIYSSGIFITFSDANLSGATVNGSGYVSGTVITATGNYVFVVIDRAGNSTGATFTIELPIEQKVVNELLSGGYQLSGSTYVGTSAINFTTLSGSLLYPMILESSNTLLGDMAQVYIPAGAVLKVPGGAGFTGVLTTPVFQDETSISVSGQTILSLMDVGNSQSISFYTTGGSPLNVTFTMPAPGMNIGDSVQVRYSHDGSIRSFETYADVQDIGGQPYVVFTANHFTQFYLGVEVGTFMIDNDAAYATGLAVTLNNNASGATQMRFGNSIIERNAASWISYTTTSSWNLTGAGGDGLKRVYAQFSGGGNTIGVSDSIILDTTSGATASGLQLHLDGSTGGVLFNDIGPRGLICTGMNGAYKTTWSGETIMGFNGTTQYIENNSGFISGYPFSISARVRVGKITGTQGIVMYGSGGNSTGTYRGIQLVNAQVSMASRNITLRTLTAGPTLAVGQWVHVVGIFSGASSRQLYVNGVSVGTQTTNGGLFSTVNPQRRVGRYVGANTNYLSGNVDEVRVYGRALTASEISGLYMVAPSYSLLTTFTGTPTLYGTLPAKIYDVSLVISGNTYTTTGAGTGLWKTNAFTTGLANGTYTVVMNYTNVYGKTGSVTYTSGLIINISGPNITYTPTSGTLTTGSVVATLTGMDPTYMIINNSGNANYTFTTNTGFTYQFIDQVGTTGYITATVSWIRNRLTYSTVDFYENTGTNNGSITGNIIVTLGTGAFSGNIVSGHYVTLANVPAGLTGAFALSGTNQLIISLSGNATNHSVANDTGNLTITFLTGAFVNMNPSDVIGYIQTGIAVHFYDVPGYISGQQLRIDGTLSGGQFYDWSPVHHITTGFSAIGNTTRSGETVMGPFNGTNQYVAIGSYTMSNYAISAWFKSDGLGAWRTIIGENGGTAFEMSQNTANKISFYDVSASVASTTTIVAGKWYHVVRVQSGTNTLMYIDGVLEQTIPAVTTMTNMALAIGKYSTTQYRNGNIDEVKIYNTPISATQVQNLYMIKPSFTGATRTIPLGNTVTLTGVSTDTQMALSVTVSGTTYPVTNHQDGTRTSSAIGPLTGGTYNVQLNYTNIYGRTGMLMYTGGLVITINWNIPAASVTYAPSSDTTGNVVATLTGFSQTGITITNNSGSANYTFTGNGSFTYQFVNGSGYTGATTATVTWLKKSILSYSTTVLYEDMPWNNGSVAGNVIVTLSTGSFSGGAANYITLTNLPAGLTGAYALSGTNKVIITLTGNAGSNAAANSVSGVIVNFLSGAFVNMSSDDVRYATKTGLSITFYDPNPVGGIYASDDVVLDADNAEANGCGLGLCQKYNYGQTTYGGVASFGSKMLMRFDIAANVPAGATITSATLRLGKYYLGPSGNPTDDGTGFKLRKIINNPGWIEGSGNVTLALTGEPNYQQRKWGQENWNNGNAGLVSGLDYEFTDLMDIGGFTGSATASYTQTFTLNSAGIATIQDWLYNSGNNQGFGIVEANKNWIYIYSDEYTGAATNRPYLMVSYIADTTAPQISSFTPLDNSSGVMLDLHPQIVFSEHVSAVSGKNLYIKKTVDNSILETINVGNTGLVYVNDTLVIVYPTTNLSSNTGYYIQIDSGAFVDRANNAFTGITGTTTWNFTSVDTASVPNVATPSISGLEYTTVTLGGTITSTGSSSVNEFGIVRGTLPGFNVVGANKLSQTGSRNTTGAFSLGIAGFSSGQTIYFRAFAANNEGTGYTTETGFTLKPDAVQFRATTLLSNDTFTVNWFAATGANHYELYLSTGATCTSYISGYSPIIVAGTGYRFINLEKETNYYYKIYAVNSGGTSPVSSIHTTATSFLPRPWVRLKFEELVGDIAYDSSENNFGVISGFPIMGITGADNKAYNFDGVDDFVSVTDLPNMDPSLTVSFWFKTTTTGNNQHIFSRGGDTGANSINVIFDQASGSLKTYINGSQTILNVTGALYTGLLNNQRHFYSLTIDNDGAISGKKLATVFLDGITKLTNSTLNSGAFDPPTNVFIGRRSENSAGTYFSGNVDDVRIYGKILTPPEINNIYLMFADTVKPTATVTYSPGSGTATTGSVVVTLTGASEAITITNNGGLSGYTFTGNGIFTFTFRDEGFNTGETTASVYWINPIFTSISGANINTLYTSNIITLTGYGAGIITGVSITTGTLYKNGVAVGQSATGSNNDQFSIQLTSSSGYLEAVSSTMTIGITSGTFIVTTKNIGIYLSGPVSFDFGMRDVNEQAFTLEKTFSGINDYFKVIDNAGDDTGYYTTISISDMTTVSGDILPYTAIAVKSLTGIVNLSGSINPRVYSAITGTYQYFTASPLTFIRRDTANNAGLTGTYGLQTIWKVDMPALQNVGNYTGVITYTLY